MAFRGVSPVLATALVLGAVAALLQLSGGPGREIAPTGPEPMVVDVNRASAAELALLPGIGPVRARAIVADRLAHGPFPELEALVRVPGIGGATVQGLRGLAAARP